MNGSPTGTTPIAVCPTANIEMDRPVLPAWCSERASPNPFSSTLAVRSASVQAMTTYERRLLSIDALRTCLIFRRQSDPGFQLGIGNPVPAVVETRDQILNVLARGFGRRTGFASRD